MSQEDEPRPDEGGPQQVQPPVAPPPELAQKPHGVFKALVGQVSWVMIGIGVLVWYICVSINAEDSIISRLSNPANARALLTYVILLAVVGMAFTLCYQAFVPASTEEHFKRAREIFASLTGILGTIVGFHFGIADEREETMSLNSNYSQNEIAIVISGGKPPYTYSVDSDTAGVVTKTKDEPASDGWIRVPVTPATTEAKVTIEVKDKNGDIKTEVEEVPAAKQPLTNGYK